MVYMINETRKTFLVSLIWYMMREECVSNLPELSWFYVLAVMKDDANYNVILVYILVSSCYITVSFSLDGTTWSTLHVCGKYHTYQHAIKTCACTVTCADHLSLLDQLLACKHGRSKSMKAPICPQDGYQINTNGGGGCQFLVFRGGLILNYSSVFSGYFFPPPPMQWPPLYVQDRIS